MLIQTVIRDKCGSRRRRKMRKGISSRMRQIVMKERLNISIFGEQYEGNFFYVDIKIQYRKSKRFIRRWWFDDFFSKKFKTCKKSFNLLSTSAIVIKQLFTPHTPTRMKRKKTRIDKLFYVMLRSLHSFSSKLIFQEWDLVV